MKKTLKSILTLFLAIIVILALMVYIEFRDGNEGTSGTFEVDKGFFPPRGNLNASIILIEFSDFACPACKASLPIVEELLKEYDILFYYKIFPLEMHENSFMAAEAALCANEQNKFWEYHDLLFEKQDNLDIDSLKSYAAKINLNQNQFDVCLDSEKYKLEVNKDLKEGESLGVQGTPTFFINGRKIFGINEKVMKQILDSELKK